MPFKVINPNFKTPPELKADQHKQAVADLLAANPTNRVYSLAEIKAALPAIATDLNQVVMNIIAVKLGLEIVDE